LGERRLSLLLAAEFDLGQEGGNCCEVEIGYFGSAVNDFFHLQMTLHTF
jgi:hypothetical protein